MNFKRVSTLLIGALCAGSAALAADAPKLPVDADTPIMPLASIGVRDGKVAFLGKWRNFYRKEKFSISDKGMIMVDNSDPKVNALFSFVDDAMLADPPRIVVVDWKSRVLEHVPNDHAIVVVNSFARIGGKGTWEQQIRFGESEIKTLMGSFKGDFKEWHAFRLVQDNVSGAYALWMDGKQLASGITRGGSNRAKPFFYIGDGSGGSIVGKAEFEYLVIGVPGVDTAPIREMDSIRVADGKIEFKGEWQKGYKMEFVQIDGKAAKLIHDSGKPGADYMSFVCTDEALIQKPPKYFAVEFKSRVLTEGPSLLAAIAPARPDKGAWEQQLIFHPDKVFFNRTSLEGNFKEFHTFRLVEYTPSGAFGLWIDGKLAASGHTLDGSARPKGFLTFGDGSGRCAGQAEFEYLVAGSIGE